MGNCCSSGAVQITTSNSTATTTGRAMQDPTRGSSTEQERLAIATATQVREVLDELKNSDANSSTATTPRISDSESESEDGNNSRRIEDMGDGLTKQVGTTPELRSDRKGRSESRLTAKNIDALQKRLLNNDDS
jgi:phage terminase small subunit